ncbi:MAG: translation initiation factor IF-2 [Magnetospiraceae bacterium]
MTDEKVSDDKKKLHLSKSGKLQLNKTVEAGKVQQSFSHGRSKTVTVEVRKKRSIAAAPKAAPATVVAKPAPKKKAAPAAPPPAPEPVEIEVQGDLTDAEKANRVKVLQEARKAEEESRYEAAARAVEEAAAARREAEAEDEKRRVEEEAARVAAQEQAAEEKQRAEEAAAAKQAAEQAPVAENTDAKPARAPAAAKVGAAGDDGADEKRRRAAKVEDPQRTAPAARRGEPRRRRGKMTVAQALGGQEERIRSLAAVRRAREKERKKQSLAGDNREKIQREVVLPETITVQELANRMAERGGNVIKALMKLGVMATINQVIDADTAELVATELGHKVKRVSDADIEIGLTGEDDHEEHLLPRAPVVTVMGHVDHGKTSLLDALRATDVVSGEAGGITQHIGAYQVTMEGGDKITFIDTPGHAAFTAMRARGASVTDIVILVVAADDGVKPQTVEAIRHARAANAPIVIAINKMDKPEANPDKVRQELLSHELVVEEMGGDIMAVEVSAKNRLNLDKLEETILLQAEVMELTANPERAAEGVVVEAKMERGRGSVATVLVQRGTLNVGDIFVAGAEWGRVRALVDDHGRNLESAGPSMPVEVLGLQGTPSAGDDFVVVDSEARAREVAEFRQRRDRLAKVASNQRGTLEQMFSDIQAGEARELPVVIKGDVQGSVEAIIGSLEKLSTEEVKVRVLHSAVGGINESDITLARASNAFIIGFNVRANPQARDMARRDGVDLRYYSVIYDVADDTKQMMSGLLAPSLRENFLGYAEIREVFNITKVGKVAGCMITEGTVKRGAKVRLLRDDVVIHEGTLSTLRRFKDEVKDVREGYECGMSFERYNDIQVGDMIECFEMEEVVREL